MFLKVMDAVGRTGLLYLFTSLSCLVIVPSFHMASWGRFRFFSRGWEATVAVHLPSILHASLSPPHPPVCPPLPLVSARLLMQSSISREGKVRADWAQRGGKSAIHVMLMPAVIEGDKVPLGDTGPLSSGDQHAAAVREASWWQGEGV